MKFSYISAVSTSNRAAMAAHKMLPLSILLQYTSILLCLSPCENVQARVTDLYQRQMAVSQSDVLQAIYDSTGGTSWTATNNWFETGVDICDFTNVTCTSGDIVGIVLRSCGLVGTLPTEVGSLSQLQVLELDYNTDLTGTIPTEIGQLISMTSFEMDETTLRGSIPSEFGLLTSLTFLDMEGVPTLTGTIPSEFGLMEALEYLYLYNTGIRGTIPTEVGLLVNLQKLYLYGTSLTGTIPTEIGQLTSLTSLQIDQTQLRGSIPSEFGLLTDLTNLDLRTMPNLTGTIPTELGQLTALTRLLICKCVYVSCK